jgi:hypothetical protein
MNTSHNSVQTAMHTIFGYWHSNYACSICFGVAAVAFAGLCVSQEQRASQHTTIVVQQQLVITKRSETSNASNIPMKISVLSVDTVESFPNFYMYSSANISMYTSYYFMLQISVYQNILNRDSGHTMPTFLAVTIASGIAPNMRESFETKPLSPSIQTCPCGTVTVRLLI